MCLVYEKNSCYIIPSKKPEWVIFMARVRKNVGKKGITYTLIAYMGYSGSGRQMVKTRTWKPPVWMSQKRADRHAACEAQLFEAAVRDGTVPADGKLTFAEYAARWRKNLTGVRPATTVQYDYLLPRIVSALGQYRLSAIRKCHIDEFIKNLSQEKKEANLYVAAPNFAESAQKLKPGTLARLAGVSPHSVSSAALGQPIRAHTAEKIAAILGQRQEQKQGLGNFFLQKNSGGLSDSTIKHHFVLLSAILKAAVDDELITTNPCTKVKPPKVTQRESKCLDDKQAKHIMSLLAGENDMRMKTAAMLALTSGCRKGELFGLTWQDIDFARRVVHVRHSSQYLRGKGVIVGAQLKTSSSKRTLDMPDFIFEILRDYRKWQAANGIKSPRLFADKLGRPQSPQSLNTWLRSFTARHSLPHFSPHTLRHSFISLQLAQGVNIRTLQARSGHARAATLLNTYAHAFRSCTKDAASKLGDLFNFSTVSNTAK
jgi:integrase